MSGPKYSRAYIRELQRLKQLERQLAERIEQSKRKQVLDDIRKLETKKSEICCNEIISECEDIIPKAEKLIPDSMTLQQIKSAVERIKQAQNVSCGTNGDSSELLIKYNEYNNEIKKLKDTVFILKDLKQRLSVEGTSALQEKRNEEFLKMEWEDTGERISTIPSDLQELYYEVIGLLAGTPDFEKNKVAIDESIMMTGDIAFKKKQLELRKSAIEVEYNSKRENLKYLELVSELRCLYEILGWEAKPIPLELSDIEVAVKSAKEEAERREKSKYIADCVHKVFEEKGYKLVDDVVVTTSGGRIKKDYYGFGEDSLINVSMSNEGQILFEVVGDGNPQEMDETRATQLESEMRRFCPNYAEIKNALNEEYGISLENERLCEPDKKYAKVVDVSNGKSDRRVKKGKKMMSYDG